ncbi:MAG: choice-of-anchor Q domain-containing protein [Limisphaerales bacterium]
MLLLVHASAGVRYVDLNNSTPASPYTSWAAAAQTIQDAIDASTNGDLILVTNGVYQTGGRVVYGALTNRVVINKVVTVQSVNGPQFTVIQGRQVPGTTNGDSAIRCLYLTNGACLSGFTLTNGATRSTGDNYLEQSGGGVWCESGNAVITNCTLAGNAANFLGGGSYYGLFYSCTLTGNSATYGGGVCAGGLTNCTLTGNFVSQNGGGADACGLVNCTLTGNFANNFGGGAEGCTITACTLSANSAAQSGGGAYSCTLYSCTLTGNYAVRYYGGGAYNGTLYNCTLTGNSAPWGGGYYGPGTLNNCTLAGNSASQHGGGVYNATLFNCALTGNKASYGGGEDSSSLFYCTVAGNSASFFGGGAYYGTLYDCLLTTNSAGYGGGAYFGTLNNCTLVSNSVSSSGGGAYHATLNNCIVWFNTAASGPNYSSGTLNNCCTTPLPAGSGNLTNAPMFVDLAGVNYRLNSNSPCINAGNNTYASANDLDGNPRIIGGTVDIGAYECQSPALLAYYTWLQNYGLPSDASAVYADSDGDGMNNWQEWRCGTDPTNPLSLLKLVSAASTHSPPGLVVTWQSVSGINYFLQSSTNLRTQPVFTTIQSNIVGQAGSTSFIDPTATNAGSYFYRVGVQ